MHVYTSYKPHFRTHHSEEKLQVVSMLNRLLHFYTFFVWSRIFSLYILIKKMSVDGWWILMDYVSTRPYDWSLSASEKHNQENKVHKTLPNLWISKINVCAMFDNQKILLLWTIFISLELLYIINKPLTCSHCVICISCSVRLSQCTTHAKDHRLIYLNYWLISKVRKSDDMDSCMHNIFPRYSVLSTSTFFL